MTFVPCLVRALEGSELRSIMLGHVRCSACGLLM
jgi:hypothetical protein